MAGPTFTSKTTTSLHMQYSQLFRVLFLCTLLCVTLRAAAQDPNLNGDSLRAIWNDTSRPDTARLKALNKLANDGYLYTRPDSAEILARQQYVFAEAAGQKKYMGTALNLAGVSLAIRGDLPGEGDWRQVARREEPQRAGVRSRERLRQPGASAVS